MLDFLTARKSPNPAHRTAPGRWAAGTASARTCTKVGQPATATLLGCFLTLKVIAQPMMRAHHRLEITSSCVIMECIYISLRQESPPPRSFMSVTLTASSCQCLFWTQVQAVHFSGTFFHVSPWINETSLGEFNAIFSSAGRRLHSEVRQTGTGPSPIPYSRYPWGLHTV